MKYFVKYIPRKRPACPIRNQASLQQEHTINQSFREYVFTIFLPTFSVVKVNLSSFGKAKQICPLWPNKICPPYLSYDYPFKSPGDGVNFILPF